MEKNLQHAMNEAATNTDRLADAIRKALDGTLGVDDGCVSTATGAVLGALKPFIKQALPDGVRTGDQVREAMRLRKLKVTNTGYEASVTGDTPEQAVALAAQIDCRHLAYKEQSKTMPSKQEPNRADLPPWITPEGNVMAAGGVTGPRNHLIEDMQKDYRVKIEITRNTKGVGWDIEVKPSTGGMDSIEEALAMRAEVERLLRAAFQTGAA